MLRGAKEPCPPTQPVLIPEPNVKRHEKSFPSKAMWSWLCRSLPFNIILVRLIGFVWCLDVVPFPYHGDITLQVTFQPGGEILRVRKDGPFVVELVLWKAGDKTVSYQNETQQLLRGLESCFHSST